jgi:hypothetical protein
MRHPFAQRTCAVVEIAMEVGLAGRLKPVQDEEQRSACACGCRRGHGDHGDRDECRTSIEVIEESPHSAKRKRGGHRKTWPIRRHQGQSIGWGFPLLFGSARFVGVTI